MQPEAAHIKGEGLGGRKVCIEKETRLLWSCLLMVKLRVQMLRPAVKDPRSRIFTTDPAIWVSRMSQTHVGLILRHTYVSV